MRIAKVRRSHHPPCCICSEAASRRSSSLTTAAQQLSGELCAEIIPACRSLLSSIPGKTGVCLCLKQEELALEAQPSKAFLKNNAPVAEGCTNPAKVDTGVLGSILAQLRSSCALIANGFSSPQSPPALAFRKYWKSQWYRPQAQLCNRALREAKSLEPAAGLGVQN